MQRDLKSAFPKDIWNNIESYLSTSDLIRLGITSKSNHQSMHIAVARSLLTDFSITQIEVMEEKAIYFLASDGRVWYCLLNNGSKKPPSFPDLFTDLPPIKKIFNANYIFLIDVNNDVWICSNGWQVNWLNDLKTSLNKPIKIKCLKNIKEIAMYGQFIFLLDMDGCVSVFEDTTYILSPIKIIENIDHLTDSSWGLFFIDKQGDVFQPQVDNLDCVITKIAGPSKISSIIKKYQHFYFLSQDGKVWEKSGNDDEVRQLACLPPIKQIITTPNRASYEFVTYFIDYKDKVWVYGSSDNGRLGLGEINIVTEPTRLENLPPIKQIISNIFETLLLDTNKKVWYLGVADYNQGEKKNYNKPTLVESLPFINSMAIGDYCNPNFIDEECNLWVKYNSGRFERSSLDNNAKYIRLIKEIERKGTLFIDQDNTLHIHTSSKIPAIKTPFNFSSQYLKKTIESCHLTLNELIVLASSRNKRDMVFQQALITSLSNENKATQFYYCIACFSLKQQHFINCDIIPKLAALLFNPCLGNSKKQYPTTLTQEDKKRYAMAEAFINCYLHVANKVKSHPKEYENFILMLIKLTQNEISNVSELKHYIKSTYNKFEMWSSDHLNLTSQYSSLRNKLLNTISVDSSLFQYFKILAENFKELLFEYLKGNTSTEYYLVKYLTDSYASQSKVELKQI